MRSFFSRYNYFFLLVVIYIISEFIVRPLGEFPLNDDWSYAKSVLKLDKEGWIDIGDWPAMTLATHLVWGFLFIKMFGFSFLVLRVSTWVSVFIGMWVLNNLLVKITGHKPLAFIACLTLLLNPLYFNMSNTFMTDVNFLTLMILVCYFAFDFFTTGKKSSFLLFYLLSLLLVLLRQYGIIAPACMTFTCWFLADNKKRYFIAACVLSLVTYVLFECYEGYLKSYLPSYAAYKFSGYINPTRRLFWDYLLYGITTRYKIVTIHAMFHTFPLTIVFLPAIAKSTKRLVFAGVSLLMFGLIFFVFHEYPMQVGNVFSDMGVGADTTYETLKGTFEDGPHFYSRGFEKLLAPLKYIFITSSLLCVLFFVRKNGRSGIKTLQTHPEIVFFLCLFFSYVVMILITESFFDRYQIPVILMSLILFCYVIKFYKPHILWSLLPLLCWYYVSVFGTRDYFTWNDKRWEAYHYLVNEKQVPRSQIDGGFEINCWNEGEICAWYDFMFLEKFDFLIQYKSEPNFGMIKEYPYQRYFPYKKDTIRIYERIDKTKRKP